MQSPLGTQNPSDDKLSCLQVTPAPAGPLGLALIAAVFIYLLSKPTVNPYKAAGRTVLEAAKMKPGLEALRVPSLPGQEGRGKGGE